MIDGPRIVPPADNEALNELAANFVDAVERAALAIYGPEFMAANPGNGRVVCLLSLAVQAIVSPEAFRVAELDQDAAAKGVGTGLGARCAGLDMAQTSQLLKFLAVGFNNGQSDALKAANAMPTTGVVQ